MSKQAKNEFYVMKAFLAAMPNMDETALGALLSWIDARGKDELSKRAGPQPQIKSQPPTDNAHIAPGSERFPESPSTREVA